MGIFSSDRNSDRWCIKFWETLQKAEKQWVMAITAWLVLDMNWFKHQPQMQNPFCVITQLIICYKILRFNFFNSLFKMAILWTISVCLDLMLGCGFCSVLFSQNYFLFSFFCFILLFYTASSFYQHSCIHLWTFLLIYLFGKGKNNIFIVIWVTANCCVRDTILNYCPCPKTTPSSSNALIYFDNCSGFPQIYMK